MDSPHARYIPAEQGADWRRLANLPEPFLTADELVAVRGLIQERYGDTDTSPVGGPDDPPTGERAAGVEHPPAPPAAHLNVSWREWAVPAIVAVLEEHRQSIGSPLWSWIEWIAPKIADAIGCCPEQAAAALLGQPDPGPYPQED